MKIDVKSLTIEQKLRLLCGKDFWHGEDLGGKLPCLRMTDASMGIRMPDESNDWDGKPSVAYPSLQVLANAWDTDIVKLYAECVADDCLDAGADIILGPGVNIKRDPLCGRNFEYFSEDPYLAGALAREYTAAAQAEGAGVCVKHFCANNGEYNRLRQSSEVDERTLREIYYKPFEIALAAEPLSVMCSYNRINGVYASEYKKGFDILRNDYGFDGVIVSDWGAVRDRTNSAKAGLDIEMPFNGDNYEKLVHDFESGKITEQEIDACAERILKFAYRGEALKAGKARKHTLEARIDIARRVAQAGIVLLKNNGVLPLEKGKSVAACGLYARPCAYERPRPELVCGGGSGRVRRLTPMFDIIELTERALGGSILYEPAFDDTGVDGAFMVPNNAVQNAAAADVNVVFAGTGANIECEGFDRATMRLSAAQEKTILDTAAVNGNTVVVLFAGAPIDMSAWIDKVAAVVYAGFCGECGGDAIAGVLTGAVNPSGKLSETFPLVYADTPAAKGYSDSAVTVYNEGVFVGYRYYDAYDIPVLFPFGHGLSYSKFEYGELDISAKAGSVRVRFTVANTSEKLGSEVSQIYVAPLGASVRRPRKELKAFAKTEIPAGKKREVCVALDISDFSYWSAARDEWVADDGVYEIAVGASSRDIRLKAKIRVENGVIVL